MATPTTLGQQGDYIASNGGYTRIWNDGDSPKAGEVGFIGFPTSTDRSAAGLTLAPAPTPLASVQTPPGLLQAVAFKLSTQWATATLAQQQTAQAIIDQTGAAAALK